MNTPNKNPVVTLLANRNARTYNTDSEYQKALDDIANVLGGFGFTGCGNPHWNDLTSTSVDDRARSEHDVEVSAAFRRATNGTLHDGAQLTVACATKETPS